MGQELGYGRPPLHKPVVMHVNGDGNDCRLVNLRFGTAAENEAMKKDHGTVGRSGLKHALAYRAAAVGDSDTAWITVDSRNAAQTATGVGSGKMRGGLKPGKSYSGNGGVLYEPRARTPRAVFCTLKRRKNAEKTRCRRARARREVKKGNGGDTNAKKMRSDTGTRTRVSSVRGSYANRLHHIG